MAPYQPIGTGYKPVGTGYNRAKGEYGVTGVLNTLGIDNERGRSPAASMLGNPPATTPTPKPMRSNPSQYLTGGQQSPAQNMLTSSPLDVYDSVRDVNGNGIIDPWEM